jgi:NADH-quinone oxidoreductase subunit A
MLENYLPVLIFMCIGLATGAVMVALGGFVLAPRKPDAAKNSPYECGFEAFEDARLKFDVRYYLVAMGIFLGILVIGFIYEWKKGALEWE